jgi:ribosome maturation factor RimP
MHSSRHRSEPEPAGLDRAAARSAGTAARHARRPSKAAGSPARAAQLSAEIEAELAEIAAAAGCELLHGEWKGGVLRLILDRPAPAAETAAATGDATHAGGVSLGDCELVAKQASALLDVLDFGSGRYLLEVSSPGLDRQLYRPSDYRRFLGRLVRVTHETAAPPGPAGRPARRTLVARLVEALPAPSATPLPATATPPGGHPAIDAPGGHPAIGAVTLLDERTGERITLRLEDIRLARLEVEL